MTGKFSRQPYGKKDNNYYNKTYKQDVQTITTLAFQFSKNSTLLYFRIITYPQDVSLISF
jgi:hypothetical protein